MRPIRITVPGRPVPKGRPRFAGGRTYTPKRTREFEELVAWYCRAADATVGEQLVGVNIDLYATAELRGDVDNYAKAVLDGLQKGGAFANDRQVISLSVWKLRGSTDETVILLTPAP